jgi:hypothetical protein
MDKDKQRNEQSNIEKVISNYQPGFRIDPKYAMTRVVHKSKKQESLPALQRICNLLIQVL